MEVDCHAKWERLDVLARMQAAKRNAKFSDED